MTCPSLPLACPRQAIPLTSGAHPVMSSQPEFPAFWPTPDAYRSGPVDPLDGIDPSFTFEFRTYDEIGDGQRWSTWFEVEPLCRGPEPRPSWVVETRGAIDTELGILKTGKEADVFLIERADPLDPGSGVVMAAKRYRDRDHRSFHRAASYAEGRSVKRSRDERALKRKSTWGTHRRRGRVGDRRVGRAQAPHGARRAGPLPGPDRRHRDPDGVDHRRRRDGTAAGADASRAGAAGVVLRPGA